MNIEYEASVGKSITNLLLTVYTVTIAVFTTYLFWNRFAVSAGLPELSIWQVWGLRLLVGAFRFELTHSQLERGVEISKNGKLSRVHVASVKAIAWTAFLGIGSLYHYLAPL